MNRIYRHRIFPRNYNSPVIYDAEVKKTAARWNKLVDEFTGGDREVREGLNKMYADKDNWQADWNKHKSFSDEV